MRDYIKYIALFIVSILVSSCQKSSEEYYNDAMLNIERNELNSALENLDKSIEINSNFALAYLERAKTKHKICISDLSKRNNESSIVSDRRIEDKKLINSVEADLITTLEFDPSLAEEIHLAKGNLFFHSKDYNRAAEEYRNSLKIDPTNKEASINLSLAYSFSRKEAEAFEVLDEMVKNDSLNAESYYIRATLTLKDDGANLSPCKDLIRALYLFEEDRDYFYNQIITTEVLRKSIVELIRINCKKRKRIENISIKDL